MIPVTYGYARVSKSDHNPEAQLRELANRGIRPGANLLRRGENKKFLDDSHPSNK